MSLGENIVETLSREIIAKALPISTRLPTSRELAVRFQTTTRTIDRAMNNLVKNGWVERIPGSGSFVKNNRPLPLRSRVALFHREVENINNYELNKAAFGYLNELLKYELEHLGYQVDIFQVCYEDIFNEKFPIVEPYKYDLIISPFYQSYELVKKYTKTVSDSPQLRPQSGVLLKLWFTTIRKAVPDAL